MTNNNSKSGQQHHGALRVLSARQRGSAVVVGILLVALVGMLALTINVGQLYYAQRNLEKIAAVAALDASRAQSGCFIGGDGTPGTLDAATTAVTSAIAANQVLSDAAVVITPTVEFGQLDSTTTPGKRLFKALAPASTSIDAVRVTLTRPRPVPLIGFPFFTTVVSGTTLTASSAVQHTPVASFTVGSTLLNIDTSKATALNSLLPALFGLDKVTSTNKLTIDVLGYQGLANATLTLGDLATALGVNLANPGALANVSLTGLEILTGMVNTLALNGQQAAADTLKTIVQELSGSPGRPVNLGDILGVDPGAEQLVALLPLNTLDVLNALAISVGQGLNPINVPNLGVSLGAVKLTNSLTILEKPVLALGRPGSVGGTPRTSANTAQIRAALRTSIDVPALATIRLGFDITVASAKGDLARMRCPSVGGPAPANVAKLDIDTSANIATAKLGTFTSLDPSVGVTTGSMVALLSTSPVGLSINLANTPMTTLGSAAESALSFYGPPFTAASQTIGSDVLVGSAASGLLASLNISVCTKIVVSTICTPLNTSPLKGPIQDALNLLTAALDLQTNMLVRSLGLQVGSATVTAVGVDYKNHGNSKGSSNSVPNLFTQDNPAAVPATR